MSHVPPDASMTRMKLEVLQIPCCTGDLHCSVFVQVLSRGDVCVLYFGMNLPHCPPRPCKWVSTSEALPNFLAEWCLRGPSPTDQSLRAWQARLRGRDPIRSRYQRSEDSKIMNLELGTHTIVDRNRTEPQVEGLAGRQPQRRIEASLVDSRHGTDTDLTRLVLTLDRKKKIDGK